LTITETPIIGLPSLASETTPETERFCWAETKHTPNKSSAIRKLIFLFMELILILKG
jgi:hypothetical protein